MSKTSPSGIIERTKTPEGRARVEARKRLGFPVYAHQVRGFLKASKASSSREPGAGLWSYWNSQ
jgi:hypothetical protein